MSPTHFSSRAFMFGVYGSNPGHMSWGSVDGNGVVRPEISLQ